MLVLGYVICYPPTSLVERYISPLYERVTRLPVRIKNIPLMRVFGGKRKHQHRFRVNESRLVRWAQEDSRMFGEEDVMVNTFDEDGDDWPMDECIPLKPGMDLGGLKVKNYGSA